MNIPIYYDPMISKLITYADTREQAIERMTRAIREYEITGVKTTLSFCDFDINHDAFKSGNFDTRFVNQYFKPEVLDNSNPEHELAIAAFMGAIGIQGNVSEAVEVTSNVKNSAWKTNRKLKA